MTISEVVAKCILHFGLSPEYVLDEMKFYELNNYLKYEYYSQNNVQNSWEQTRLQMWSSLAPHNTKTIELKELLPLYWDDKKDIEKISREEFQMLKNEADKTLKNLIK